MRRRLLGVVVLWAALPLAFALAGPMSAARAAAGPTTLTLQTDELAGPALMGLGVQWDPYDSFQPTPADWDRAFHRLDFMHPGFLRVVEPAYNYFAGYDAAHNPVYRWNARHVVELRRILDYAQSHGITVVLGDWLNPLIGGDARIPADFLAQLREVYAYTNIKYYNLINEPNDMATCDFGCWTGIVRALSAEFARQGIDSWLKLVGPDNENSWDDTPSAQALDRTSGLDTDNPLGGDSWVTATLQAIPHLIGAYDSHRYATIWGIENGVYEDQMRARREQISNLVSPAMRYFGGEVGMVAESVSPFSALDGPRAAQSLAPLIDPSATPSAGAFVDSQPHIRQFAYGVWMGDMAIQGIDAGMAGASAWDLDDAMHYGGHYGSHNLKQWGFWNSLGGQDGYPASDLRLRPWYYPWSVLARSFPAGSEPLVIPDSGVPGLRVAAAKIPDVGGYGLSLAVVNDSATPRSITLSVPSVADPLTLARYNYFADDRPVDASGLPVPAKVLQDVVLSAGVAIHLPSRGIVVLSSLGSGTSTRLNDATRTVLDDLGNWHKVAFRSGRWRLDHSVPAYFNDDRSRATPNANGAGYLVYRAGEISSFELKAYCFGRGGIGVYGSEDGKTWTPISLALTHPAPALGSGGWYLTEILPRHALPPRTNWLKLKLTNHRTSHTELSQVVIRAG